MVSDQYLEDLPQIYRSILRGFRDLEPHRKRGYGLAFQTLFEHLRENYSPQEILKACEQMRDAKAVEIKNRIFVHPTELGEEIIEGLTGHEASTLEVPPFPIPLNS